MKKLLLFFLLLPSYVIACDCDPPSVALEFVRSEYVFWGTVIEKEYAQDSQTYTVTFNIDRHFKDNKDRPRTLKFTEKAEGKITGHYTSCDYSVNRGEKWLVYAYNYKNVLVFNDLCSNSNRYKAFGDIKQKELEILEKGNQVDLSTITFDQRTVGSLYQVYQNALPDISIDTLLTQLNSVNYRYVKDSHFENVVFNVDANGQLVNIFIPARADFKTTDVYDMHQIEFIPTEQKLTLLQKDIIRSLKKAKKWTPAKFTGVNVRSQIFVQVYFKKGKAPYILNY